MHEPLGTNTVRAVKRELCTAVELNDQESTQVAVHLLISHLQAVYHFS